jgi:hypothetical protein
VGRRLELDITGFEEKTKDTALDLKKAKGPLAVGLTERNGGIGSAQAPRSLVAYWGGTGGKNMVRSKVDVPVS